MADNLKGIPFHTSDEGTDFPSVAKDLVYQEAVSRGVLQEHPTFARDEVYVVWFAFTLGNWKALCSTSLPDGKYYEVTHHHKRNMTYVDTYVKVANHEVETYVYTEETS